MLAAVKHESVFMDRNERHFSDTEKLSSEFDVDMSRNQKAFRIK